MKNLATIFIIVSIGFILFYYWPEKEINHPEGTLIKEEPYQKNIADGRGWIKDEYLITALAEYKIKARVLGKETYYFDNASEISKYDLALGWGRMSDQKFIDHLDIWQSGRWAKWKADRLPLPKKEIESHFSNDHIIAANEEVENILSDVIKGNVISIEGYLVDVRGPGGFRWASSLSRKDRGDGACEIIYVEKLRILK